MQLNRISYAQFRGDPREWVLEPVDLERINLIVGKNASGKSRTLNITVGLANLLSGRTAAVSFSGEFEATFGHEGTEWHYTLHHQHGQVTAERLTRGTELLLDRKDNGEGTIWSEELGRMMRFQAPPASVAAFARQDAIQHSYLHVLKDWGDATFHYPFGKDLGQSIFALPVPGGPPPNIHDASQTTGVFRMGVKDFGEAYISAIISDMNDVGYRIDEIKTITPTTMLFQTGVPFEPQALAVKELQLKALTEQIDMSQGMFRALSILIHLNYGLLSGKAGCVIIDDIGEGLDFARSDALIKILVAKVEKTTSPMQLLMASNDRFVMNSVPLKYWTVLDRRGSVVHVYNEKNSRDTFESFKFTGLNNFDFLATDFIHAKEEHL